MNYIVVYCLSFTLILPFLLKVNGDCIWYGQCFDKHKVVGSKNCYYNGSAKPTQDPIVMENLRRYCPEYVTGDSASVCCNGKQLTDLAGHMPSLEALLKTCSSCWHNFKKVFCATTCDPNQHEFMKPKVSDYKREDGQVTKYVSSVDVFFRPEFANGMYNSCKNVLLGGEPVLRILCERKMDSCNGSVLLNTLGVSVRSPFPMYFHLTTQPKSFNSTIIPCSSAKPGEQPCACQDCEESCPLFDPKPYQTPPTNHWGTEWWFLTVCLGIMLLCILTVCYTNLMDAQRKPAYQIVDKCNGRSKHDSSTHTNGHGINTDLSTTTTTTTRHWISIPCSHPLSICLSTWRQVGIVWDVKMREIFMCWGSIVARNPVRILLLSWLISIILCTGIALFNVTTDPIDLWSAPSSRARLEKEHFDANFMPFFRVEQVILRPRNLTNIKSEEACLEYCWEEYTSLFTLDFLQKALQLQNYLTEMSVAVVSTEGPNAPNASHQMRLRDICYKPMAPDNDNCAIFSPLQFFHNSAEKMAPSQHDDDVSFFTDWKNHLIFCLQSPFSVVGSPFKISCLSEFGAPINPTTVLGGFTGQAYNSSKAIIITFLVENEAKGDGKQRDAILSWEAAFIQYLKKYQAENEDIIVTFNAQRSVEDEIDRQSRSDLPTMVLSYGIMFLYITFTLGQVRSCKTFMIDCKVTLGIAGVLIVLLSVFCSLGVFSYMGLPASLIVIEVVPFLVLAVGVDNIFIIVQTYQRLCLHRTPVDMDIKKGFTPHLSAERKIALTLGQVGPSILLTSLSESVAFFFGGLTNMPAVKMFSLYAAMAVFVNFFLQITCFLAFLTLDARRQEAKRLDVFCCVKYAQKNHHQKDNVQIENDIIEDVLSHYPCPLGGQTEPEDEEISYSSNTKLQTASIIVKPGIVPHPLLITPPSVVNRTHRDHIGFIDLFVNRYYSKWLLSKWVRPLVILLFVAWFLFSISMISRIEKGLDQKLAMPEDSYVVEYLDSMHKYLAVGPPLYIVVAGNFNYSEEKEQNLICGASGCSVESVLAKVFGASNMANITYVAQPATSWLDDYFMWIDPDLQDACCRIHKTTKEFCPSIEGANQPDCIQCPLQHQNKTNRPTSSDFMRYLPLYLNDNPNEHCPKGGKAAYSNAVKVEWQGKQAIGVSASYFMTYHTVLKTSHDYIAALQSARILTDNMNEILHREMGSSADSFHVYPYSVFFVFYEQYLTIWHDLWVNVSGCLVAIFVVTTVLLALDFHSAGLIVVTVVMVMCSMLSLMAMWDITLNAVSLVNLIMAVGISVEFCSHMVRAFVMDQHPSRITRAENALCHMGVSVFNGAMQSFAGIIVLATAKSQLFRIFYFRMYFGTVLFGMLHGLVFLPVLLSYLGPIRRSNSSSQEKKVSSDENVEVAGINHHHQEQQQHEQHRHHVESMKLSSSYDALNEVVVGRETNHVTSSPPPPLPSSASSITSHPPATSSLPPPSSSSTVCPETVNNNGSAAVEL